MTKRNSIIWIGMFLIIIVSPTFTYFFLEKYVDTTNYENRDTATKAILTTKNCDTFPKVFESYYNDNIPYRNQWITLNNSIDYYLFRQSSSDRVLLGSDGWLFYCDSEDSNPTEQSLGYWKFSETQLENIANCMMLTKNKLESQGIEFVLFIAPNKESIYRDKIPNYYKLISKETSTDQLVKYLKENTDIKVVYPYDKLMNVKEGYPDIFLYHKSDTHWNNMGGYIGATCLADELGLRMPSIKDISLTPTYVSSGDLTNMLNIKIKDGDVDYVVKNADEFVTESKKWDFNSELTYHTLGADPRKIFVRGDSFATSLAPNVATQFENSIFVHQNLFDWQQVFDYNADIFVLEMVERYVGLLDRVEISFIKSSVKSDGSGKKNISISPAINGLDLQYVSIIKNEYNAKDKTQVQLLKPLRSECDFQVPESECGEVYVYIFSDAFGERVLEEVRIPY